MSTAGPKQQVFASLAGIAQALGHAHRLELLEHLGQGERSVEDLAARSGLRLANASRHLQLLRRAALVEGRREGKRVYYRLTGEDAVIGQLGALSRVGERNSAEIEKRLCAASGAASRETVRRVHAPDTASATPDRTSASR